MFYVIFIVAAGAVLYLIKGGQHGPYVRPLIIALTGLKYFRRADNSWGYDETNVPGRILARLFDGKILSSLLFGGLCVFAGQAYDPDVFGFVAAALGWVLGVAPSVRENIRSVGGYLGPMQDYSDRAGAFKMAAMRGVFMGAVVALGTGNIAFIVTGALYPLAIWLGNSVSQFYHKRRDVDWHVHEAVYGAVFVLALFWPQ